MIGVRKPGLGDLSAVVDVLRAWQSDALPVQLHPGDLGWQWRLGAQATAAAVWLWSRDGRVLAIGLLDSPEVLRLAIAPEAAHDEELARQMAADVMDPEHGVLPRGEVSVEARFGDVFRALLSEAGWKAGERWTPLRRDLSRAVPDCGVRIEVTRAQDAEVRVGVQRAAFEGSTFTAQRWHAMAAGSPYGDARCLVGYDDHGTAVAAVTVWSAGPDRPGLLEPMGVHRDHRGRGYGTAITLAAAAALQAQGSSSAVVCTRSANVGAVATYESAGFRRLAEVPDLQRSASTTLN